MKNWILSIMLSLASCDIWATTPATETRTPVSASVSLKTETARVAKVYSAEQDGAIFRAYVVTWNGAEVVITDLPTLGTRLYQVGDMIAFRVHRVHLDKAWSQSALSFVAMPESEPPAPTKEASESPGAAKAR